MRTALVAGRLRAARAVLRPPRRALGLAATLLFGSLFPPPDASAQESLFSLDGLIVTAGPTPRSAGAVASHVTVLEGAALRALGIVSAVEALRDVAGVDVVQSGSFGAVTSLFMRGGESDYTLVLVDGVQVNQAGGGFDLASLSLDNVERIEVVRGPASALYGSDAMAGVIHVITRTGQGPVRGRASVETGSFGESRDQLVDAVRWSADLWGGSGSAGYSASLAHDANDGLLAFNNRHESTVLSGSARFAPDARTRVDLGLRLAERRYHFPTDGSGTVADSNSFTFSDETLGHLRVARRVSRRLELEGRVGLFGSDGGTDDAPDGPADTLGFFGFTSLDHFRRLGAEARAHVEVGPTLMTVGAEVEQERQRSFSESLSEYGPSNGRSESERENRALFLHGTGEIGGLALHAGGRIEDNERFGTFATWQAGVSTVLPGTGGVRLRAAAGRALKEPTFFENFSSGFALGNPDLDPETTLAWEVGLERSLIGGRTHARATFFTQSFRDLIQYTFSPPSPGDPNFFNVAAARARGVELDVDVGVGPLRAGAVWTWLDTEVTDSGFESGPGATFVEGEALLRRPTHTWALRAEAPVGTGGRVYSRVSFVGARADRDFATFPATPVELPGRALWALGGAWSLWPEGYGRPDASLSVRVENLLDHAYEEALGFRAPGRQLYVGLSVGLGG
jgi:vitamin B12 transporter